MPISEAASPRLLDRLRTAIRLRHFSPRTEEVYTGWARRYILFHRKRHPSDMGESEVAAFLTHLSTDRHVSASTQNQAMSALLFLYRHVLGRELGAFHGIVWAKRSDRVPVVLTRVVAVLAELSGPVWLIAAFLYGAGLGLTECLELRVKDIEIESSQIVVREGKGGRDRRTPFPMSVVEPFERHLKDGRHIHARDSAAGFGRVWLPDGSSSRMRRRSGDGSLCFRQGASVGIQSGAHHPGITCTSPSFNVRLRRPRAWAGLAKRVSCHAFRSVSA